MLTKFHNWGSRELADSHWRWIVTAGVRTESPKQKREFLSWMKETFGEPCNCLLYTSPSPRDVEESRMPSSA